MVESVEVSVSSLGKEARENEGKMPNVPLEAICTGGFLLSTGYRHLGNDTLYKKEEKGVYVFVALPQTATETHSSVPLHPFYRLKEIC